jgi:CRP-like cAMP-binding protein
MGGAAWAAPRSGNRLLDTLAMADSALLQPHLAPMTLLPGAVLHQDGETATQAIFPCDSTVLSIQIAGQDGRAVEAVPIGSEGMLGWNGDVAALASFHSVVQVGGPALRLETGRLLAAAGSAPGLKSRLDAYHSALLGQALQAVACAALHPVEARACRRLLSLHDRIGQPELPLTQAGLADSLGVRRTTITRIMAGLAERGLIRHRRGRILVLDRAGLEAASCDCHAAIGSMFARLAPGLFPPAIRG